MKAYKYDIILILSVLVCAGLVFSGVMLFQKPGAYVYAESDGKTVFSVPLTKEEQVFTVDAPSGGRNIVTIRDEKVSVTEASCPDKICMKQGEISAAGQCIICLPNKLIVSIGGDPEADMPDVIAQ